MPAIIYVAAAQITPAVVAPPKGFVKVRTEKIARNGHPNAMYGRNLPNLERVRSAMAPIIGSFTASQILAPSMIAETIAGVSPTISV